MPRQVLELIDYFAPIAALLMFGAQFNICLGPHSMSDIYRGGPKSQFNLQKVEPEETVVVQRAGRPSSEMREKF
uniref:Uncharacterized protein n=1 Tax=Meloidogyne hapla TaxID=6305 RepID=A0A1I8AWN8_MELHA